MIDPSLRVAAMAKHGRAQILALPVFCRVPADEELETVAGPLFPASFSAGTGDLLAVDGGIIYDRGGNLSVARVDWPETAIEETLLEMLIGGTVVLVGDVWTITVEGSWKLYNIENTSAAENPNASEIRLAIGPPNK